MNTIVKFFFLIFFFSFYGCSSDYKKCIETYEIGTILNEGILKQASQIWRTPDHKTIILFNSTGIEDNYNNHLLLFDKKLKLEAEIHFSSTRIEKIINETIYAREWEQSGGAYLEMKDCRKTKLGKYVIKYEPYKMYGSEGFVMRLVDKITVSDDFYAKIHYRVKEDNQYYHIENAKTADKDLTQNEILNLPINLLDFNPYQKHFAEITRNDSIKRWEYFIPKNDKILEQFYLDILNKLKENGY
jgi:hypothetical protein